MIDREGFQFDLETQRFIKNRWETETGERALKEIIESIKSPSDLRWTLDAYVLEHKDNIDPYGHPIYPKDAMAEGAFWVLTQDDLRGASFSKEDFSNSPSLGKKSLSYSSFHSCNLEKVNLDRSDLSYARIEKCNLKEAYLSNAGGYSIKFIECELQNTLMNNSGFIDCNFSDSDLSGAFFDESLFENIKLNYLTKFDHNLTLKWENRDMPTKQVPDILRAIRIGYEKAELWDEADKYLLEEKTAYRKYILWEVLRKEKSFSSKFEWFKSYFIGHFSGYATKPMQIIYTGILISLFFAIAYAMQGDLSNKTYPDDLLESIYFSFTTFATLGYGDLAFKEAYPYMRIVSTVEAWLGAITISIFVAVLARKILRSG